jgi:hypothetical protein
MGYDKFTLKPYRTRRFNISFHSLPLEEGDFKPLEILIRDTASTKIHIDVTNLIIENNGDILH